MIHEELYIIVDGARKKLDLPSPSGITLNFVSNLFNDLSKINASYSYTFKLPRTANNVRVLELVDDVRADGKFTRIKNDAEFVYDGVSLFANANMYISDVEKDTISALLTWNVNKGLQELSKHDISLNKLGDHLPEGMYDYVGDAASNYEKDKVVLIGDGTYDEPSDIPVNLRPYLHSHSLPRPAFNKYTEYDPTQPYFKPLYNGGVPPYRMPREFAYSQQGDQRFMNTYPLYEDSEDGKLSPMNFVYSDQSIEFNKIYYYTEGGDKVYVDNDDKCHYPVFPFPTPVIPVPYLISVIEEVFGVQFDLSGDAYNALCLPLVNTEMSDGLARRNYIRLTFGVEIDCLCLNSATIYLHTPNINTLSDAQIGYVRITNNVPPFDIHNVVTCNTIISRYSKMKILVWGKITIKVQAPSGIRYYDDNTKATLTFWCQNYEDDKKFYKVGTLYATEGSWHSVSGGTSYEELVFNCDPDEGFEVFESEDLYRPSICITLSYGDSPDTPNELPDNEYYVMDVTGEFKMSFKVVEYPMNCHINMFQNLPDISCLDFVKSIFYALGGYPYQDADGKIKLQQYKNLIQLINDGDVYNWQNKSLKALGNQAEEFDYDANNVTGLTLGYKNYFLMKNDKVDDYGNEEENDKLNDAYEHGYKCIEVDSDLLKNTQTIYTFPYQGGFLWCKGYYSMREYHRTIPLATNKITGLNGIEFYEGDLTPITLIGQDRWIVAEDGNNGGTSFRDPRYKSREAKPMLGVIQPIRVPIASTIDTVQTSFDPENPDASIGGVTNYHVIDYQDEDTQYLSMRPWNCANDMPMVNGRNLLQELFGNPCLVKEDMNLNVMDLATLDVEKPVYLEKYNSYFAIKNIEVGSDGISKVELIRIPPELFDPAAPTPEIVVEEPTLENGGDNGGSFEVVDPWAEP